MDLNKYRDEINGLDQEMLELLSRRRKVARQVIETKDENGLPLRDVEREEQLLDRLIKKGRELELDAHFVTQVFHEIIDDSVRYQQSFLQRNLNPSERTSLRVGYQGVEGAYSYLASKKFFAEEVENTTFIGCTTFAEVVELVEDGGADYALLPVENTTAGSINEVYDLLSRTKLSIVGEEIFRVQHCLLAIENVPLSNIRRVFSHPQALAQCSNFLSEMTNCQREYFADTAMAVKKVRDDKDLSQAAIASDEAGRLYGLKVLRRNLADQPDNFTRFLVVAPKPIRVDPRVPSKTSLIMSTAHHEGALLRALSVLHQHGINCTKLESRPKPGSPFEYLFYLDFEGSQDEQRVQDALDELRGATAFLKVLGSYPIERRNKTRPLMQSIVGAPEEVTEAADKALSVPAVPLDVEEYRHASRRFKPEDTRVRVRDVVIGGGDFVVAAGPPAVESEEQIRACAREVKERGGKILFGRCFRTTTSPRGFPGLGHEGIDLLSAAARAYDLPSLAEVVSPEDVRRVAHKVDMLMVGARNMQNSSLLAEVGKVDRPVLLKRGLSASLEDLLHAAEAIMAEGNQQVVLCERGIRTFETTTRNTLDIGAIPILDALTHLPVLVDPSHAAGQRDLVIPLALAAHAVGPDGLIVEVHPDPASSRAEAKQALGFADFGRLMSALYR